MTVHFIGAGPGAADLITLRGRDLLARCPVCLYAGSIMPPALLQHCPPGARLVDTGPLDLDAIEAECLAAHGRGQDVARLHSGDLSLYSAVAEQARRLRARGVPVSFTPGVPAFAAAAAVLQRELTLPGLVQSVVLTRVGGRATAVPAGESLAAYAATGATLAIHLAIHALDRIVAELTPVLGADCPVAAVERASWPDERVVRATLGTVAGLLAAAPIERTALVLVGRALAAEGFGESALYDPGYRRRFRNDPRSASGTGADERTDAGVRADGDAGPDGPSDPSAGPIPGAALHSGAAPGPCASRPPVPARGPAPGSATGE